MEFTDKYTTSAKVTADKTEIEKTKVVISNDAYSNAEMLNEVAKKLEGLRIAGIKK